MSFKKFIERMNKYGVPVPTARDPKTGLGSVSFSLVCVSSLIVVFALLNMFAKLVQGVDVVNALYWNGMCLALYFGRSHKKDEIGPSTSKESDSE